MGNYLDFIERKKREYERALARHAERSSPLSWRMKLRVRILHKLNNTEVQAKGWFAGRRITVKSRRKGQPLNEADCIIFIANRFKSAEAAVRYGIELQTALSALAALRYIPIDVGPENGATTAFSDHVKDAIAKKGSWLIDDVHGVDVYPDTQTAMVSAGDITLTQSHDVGFLLHPLEIHGKAFRKLDERSRDAALLVNAAFMAQHPAAMLILGVAAVELLAAGQRWNSCQLEWIGGLEQHLADNSNLTDGDRVELRQAINAFRSIGAVSRTRRLISDLHLDELLPRWKALYDKRSRFVHGDIIASAEIQALGGEARHICHAIVQAYILRLVGPVAFA